MNRPHRVLLMTTLMTTTMRQVLVVLYLWPAFTLATTVKFNSTPYHITGTEGPKAESSCLRFNDVHRLTGEIRSAHGGNVTVHNDNGTISDDYTLAFSTDLDTFTGAYMCKGRRIHITGFDAIHGVRMDSIIFKSSTGGVLAGLTRGGTWRPPLCSTAHNQSSCDQSLASCSWCVSPDRVHGLCFDSGKKPPGWKCD